MAGRVKPRTRSLVPAAARSDAPQPEDPTPAPTASLRRPARDADVGAGAGERAKARGKSLRGRPGADADLDLDLDTDTDTAPDTDLETLHASIAALGAPPLAHAELAGILARAPACGAVLRVFVERVVGRAAVRCVRGAMGGGGGGAGGDDAEDDDAARQLRVAEEELARARHEADAGHARLVALERDTDALHAVLRRTRRAHALIATLGKKEAVRTRRVRELGGRVRVVRDDAQAILDANSRGAHSEEHPTTWEDLEWLRHNPARIRADAVLDTLAMLQGHHARLARLVAPVSGRRHDQVEERGELEAHLLVAVAQAVGKSPDDAEARQI
ncbi:hypothetical protein EIP86_006955 [Pleurotus ostreatoroseus]|nr:hypothetical protein EIP86_006955 [Pleurotus ostreatoroseus]